MARTRPGTDAYFLAMAYLVSLRATCSRRMVGCVLVDEKHHVLATGYNGPPRGFPHCIDHPCEGATAASGTGLDLCAATHAEANALLQCPDNSRIRSAYCTTAPCIHCVKLLLNTGCQRLIYGESYPHANKSLGMWEASGRFHDLIEDYEMDWPDNTLIHGIRELRATLKV